MNITFDEKLRVFRIDTESTTYMIGIVDEEQFLGHIYYGPAITDADATYLLRTQEAPFVPTKNSRDRSSFLDCFPHEIPGSGVGDYREGMIELTDEDGHTAVQFLYESHEIFHGKKPLRGLPATFGSEQECMTLEITATEPVLGLAAVMSYSIFAGNDAIVRSVRLINNSKKNIRLNRVMSMALDMDDDDYELLTLHGTWARERAIDRRPICYGRTNVGSTRGESSHQEHPFMALVQKRATEETGRVYGFHFVYSGNFLAQAEKSQFDSIRVLMGIHPTNFEWKLEPGEEFTAPEVVMVCSDAGLGKMSRTLHDLYREHLIRSKYVNRERPILINNWEATYFDFNTEKLLSIAREAKKLGIEMLVMDDGWFGHRSDDNSSLGDWYVNEDKLQGGLATLVSEVNKIGLKFGIWFEPEMISPDSDLYRAHPDWAIAVPGRKPCRSRNQYVLDLTRPEVVDYVYECVAKVLRSANIEYVKWDMNRQISDIGSAALPTDRQGELSHRYVLAVYELQERLTSEFPDLLLENCSGGGARFDPGMLYYSPQIWCSDDTDAIERLSIQEGTSLIYPLSAMGAHVSDCPNHTVGRNTPFETRGIVALAGTFGYELDVTRIPQADRDLIPAQTRMYHRYHKLVRSGDYYRIASYRENRMFDCYGVVAKDKSEALFTFVQVVGRPNVHSRIVKLAGLDPKKRYLVERDAQNVSDGDAENAVEKLTTAGAANSDEMASAANRANLAEIYCGDTLMNAGLRIENMWGDYRATLIHLTQVEE